MDGRLRQLEMVGRGAMAQVFRGALHGEHGTSRPVAIKRLRPELRDDPAAVDLFVNEAKIAVRLDHPNVVHALELTRDNDGYALVCEWLECASLQEMIEAGRTLPIDAVVHVGRSLCNALDYLHNLTGDDGDVLGLVHRDVTPANVFVTRGGEVKLTDFGVAWCRGGAKEVIAGTPEFAAPEQQQGVEVDARADVYGVGATLRAVAAEVPADLAPILERACAENRETRFASARELSRALEGVTTQFGSTTSQRRMANLLADCRSETAARGAPRLDLPVQTILGDALTGSRLPDVPTRPVRRRRWPLVLVPAVLVLLGLTFLTWQLATGPEATAPAGPRTAVVPAGEPAKELHGAVVEPRAKPEERIAIEPSVRLPPEHTATEPPSGIRRPAAPVAIIDRPVKATRRAPPSEPAPADPPAVSHGMVSLNATPWARVEIDGRKVGNTPIKELSLPSGEHTVVLFNPAQKLRREVVIHVDAERSQTFLIDLRRGTVHRRAQR